MPFKKHPEPPLPQPSLDYAAAAAEFPRFGASLPLRTVCRIVRQLIGELVCLFADRVMLRRDRRRLACHVRQISMYVCHVALQIPMHDIGEALGRDRTTVGHACHVVEDRRDDPAFDEFVSAAERMVTTVFGISEVHVHD
jgi:hypothetical protein